MDPRWIPGFTMDVWGFLFGIGLGNQGFRSAWDITGQQFQGVGLKSKAFILTVRDLASHLCRKNRVSDFANFSMETHFPNSSGPTHLGPVWAHPRGPGLGPPIWAQLGPTHGGPHISGSPERLTTLPQALFFSRKMAPIFLEALSFRARCRRRLFFQKNGPHIFGSPELLGTLPQALFFQKNGPPYF